MNKIKKHSKTIIVLIYFAVAFCISMMRLPSFVGNDKIAHLLFYFITAMFLNAIYDVKDTRGHFLIFVFLFCFGVGIEALQEYSNTFFHKRIHGNFDIHDVIFNLFGILLFSVMWFVYSVIEIFKNRFAS